MFHHLTGFLPRGFPPLGYYVSRKFALRSLRCCRGIFLAPNECPPLGKLGHYGISVFFVEFGQRAKTCNTGALPLAYFAQMALG